MLNQNPVEIEKEEIVSSFSDSKVRLKTAQEEIQMELIDPDGKAKKKSKNENCCQKIQENPREFASAGVFISIMLSGAVLVIYGISRIYITNDNIEAVIGNHNETVSYSPEERKDLIEEGLKTNNPTLIIIGVLMLFSPLLIDYVRKRCDLPEQKTNDQIDHDQFDDLLKRLKSLEDSQATILENIKIDKIVTEEQIAA